MLLGCTQMPAMNVLPNETREHNPECMDMRRFKVFQVFEDDYALANACTASYDENFCIGAVVLLTPQRNIEYYDDMYVSAPNEKCAVQDGVFKYETKDKKHKTVPKIRFEYEFSAISEEEELTRFHDEVEDMRFACTLNKKQYAKSNIKKCNCIVDFVEDMVMGLKGKKLSEEEKENFQKKYYQEMEKKCGKIPDLMKE